MPQVNLLANFALLPKKILEAAVVNAKAEKIFKGAFPQEFSPRTNDLAHLRSI